MDRKICRAVVKLRNNIYPQVDEIPAELFKAAGKETIMELHSSKTKAWKSEEVPDDW
jgi:hypothetical protein